MATIAPQLRGLETGVVERPWRRTGVVAITLGVVGLLLSAAGSWIPSLWGDEAASVLSAERSLPSLFRMLGHVDAVHGSYYLFLHFWVDLFGTTPFSVRLPSAIAVGLMVAGVVFLGSRLGGLRMGVIAGVVALVLPRTTYMGEETRAYALSAACAVWLTLLLVRLVDDPLARRRAWVLYGVGVAICGYVFLFSLLLLVAHAAIVLSLRRRELATAWAKATGLGLALALPVIFFGAAERQQVAFLTDRTAATFTSVTIGQWFENPFVAGMAWALIIAAIGISFAGFIRQRLGVTTAPASANSTPSTPRHLVLIAVWALAPTAILLIANSVHAIYSGRYLSFCVPAVALLIASLLTRIRRGWLAGALVLALAVTAASSYVHDRTAYAKNGSDWAVDASIIQANANSGDGILFDEAVKPSKNPRLAMRTYPAAFLGLNDVQLKSPWYDTNGWRDSVYPLSQVTDRLNGVHTVWVIEYRAAGTNAGTYDLSRLRSLGYTVSQTFDEHSSVILKMEN